MPGSKASYLEFCAATYVPLHLQPWWLDAVCHPDAWEVAIAGDHQGVPDAVLPYFKTRRWGLPVIQLPPLSAYAGPWFLPANASMPAHKRLQREAQLLKALIGQLPKTAFFHQCFRPEIQNWLPFYWAGFKQTQQYTYVLPAPLDPASLYAGLKGSVRTDLRRAKGVVEAVREASPTELFHQYTLSFDRKGRRPIIPFSAFSRLYHSLSERRQGQGFVALDREQGRSCAGLYLAFDNRQAAVLLSGFDPRSSRCGGALNSLYWEAIRFCAARKISLDFEGSMHPGIERVFRAFGGQLQPYFRVWRAGNKVLDWLY